MRRICFRLPRRAALGNQTLLQTNQTKQPSKFVQIVFIPRAPMKSVRNFYLDTEKKKTQVGLNLRSSLNTQAKVVEQLFQL